MAKVNWLIRDVEKTTQNTISGYARSKGIENGELLDMLANSIGEDGFNILDLDEDTKRKYKVYAARNGLTLAQSLAKIIEIIEKVEGK